MGISGSTFVAGDWVVRWKESGSVVGPDRRLALDALVTDWTALSDGDAAVSSSVPSG